MSWIRNKHAVVTGAAGGLGAALCQGLLDRGCRVSGLDVDAEGLAALPPGIEKRTCDLRDGPAVLEALEELRRSQGPVDLAIANAGVTHLRNFTAGESGAVRRVMEINFFGAVHLVDGVIEELRARRGMAVAISSVAGFAPLIGRTAYAASKHAMHGFFDTLRLELRDDGVDVLLVCPSYIATGIREKFETGDSDEAMGRVIGRQDSPESAARSILGAIDRRRRFLSIGRVGHLARWIHRLSPRLYETMMLRRIRQER